MEEDSKQFLECDISIEQCIMDYYENHLKLKTHKKNLKKLDKNYSSSWNKHMKKHAGFANI